MKSAELPKEVYALAYETDLAKLVKTKEQFGEWLTCFLLHELGDENPYKECIVSIVGGEDAGKKFVANFGKPQRFLEPLTIALVSAIKESE
ncbi:MAG: hypothetical protein WCG44_03850 [bacterium]